MRMHQFGDLDHCRRRPGRPCRQRQGRREEGRIDAESIYWQPHWNASASTPLQNWGTAENVKGRERRLRTSTLTHHCNNAPGKDRDREGIGIISQTILRYCNVNIEAVTAIANLPAASKTEEWNSVRRWRRRRRCLVSFVMESVILF